MESLFEIFKTRTPAFDKVHKPMFNSVSVTGGANTEKKEDLGKIFANNYELYTYAFFLGLYTNTYEPIENPDNKKNFSHPISNWGNEKTGRKDWSILQKYMFTAVIAHTNDIDFIGLEKGEISANKIVRQIQDTLEAYTNGGLTILAEKLETESRSFTEVDYFLNLILEAKQP